MGSADVQSHIRHLLGEQTDVILTGAKNSGKSSLCSQLAADPSLSWGGFVTFGVWEGREKTAYMLYRLSSGESKLLASLDPLQLQGETMQPLVSRFTFSCSAFQWAKQGIVDDLSRDVQAVCIDEIGPVELQKQGFYDILRPEFRSKTAAYLLVIRQSLLSEIVELLSLEQAIQVKVDPDYE